MKTRINKSKGFTLVESLVAVSILSISVAAIFTAVQMSLKTSLTAKDQITAIYLSQEAMEFIKNVRDENALNSLNGVAVNWLHGLSENSSDPCWYGADGTGQKVCTLDVYKGISGGGVAACSGGFGTCPNLNHDSVTGLFGYTTGETWKPTNFKREIKLVANGSNSVDVTIHMQWVSSGITKTFQVTGSVFNKQ